MEGLSNEFDVFAITDEGVIEAIAHQKHPILGIQWHPERLSPNPELNRLLVRKTFLEQGFWHS